MADTYAFALGGALLLALTVALLVPVIGLARRHRLWRVAPDVWIGLTLLLAAGLAVAEALNGHARTDAHPAIEVSSVAAHLPYSNANEMPSPISGSAPAASPTRSVRSAVNGARDQQRIGAAWWRTLAPPSSRCSRSSSARTSDPTPVLRESATERS